MPDREKVLELVESIIAHAEDERTNRSWESDDIGWKNVDKIWDCSQQLKELLKEQEPKKPEWRVGRAHCPECGELFPKKKENQYIRFCSFCGQAVKWE